MRNIILFFLIIIPTIGISQDTLTLGDAIRKLSESPVIKIEEYKVLVAKYQTDISENQLLPTLKLNGRFSHVSDVDPFSISIPVGGGAVMTQAISTNINNQYQLKATVTQPIFTGFKLSSIKSALNFQAEAQQATSVEKKVEYQSKLIELYTQLLILNKSSEVTQLSIQWLKQFLIQMEQLEHSGLITKNDRLKVDVRLSDMELRWLKVNMLLSNLHQQLSVLLGDDVSTKYILTEPQPFSLAIGKKDRSEIIGIQKRLKAAEAQIQIQQSDWYPSIYLQANVDYANPNARYFPASEKWNSSWDIHILFTWDIWTWNTRQLQTQQAVLQNQQLKLTHQQLTEKSIAEYQLAKKEWDIISELEKTTEKKLMQTKENYLQQTQLYTHGLSTLTDVLQSESEFRQAELESFQVKMEKVSRSFQLNKVSGEVL